jgi:hypothetical protein
MLSFCHSDLVPELLSASALPRQQEVLWAGVPQEHPPPWDLLAPSVMFLGRPASPMKGTGIRNIAGGRVARRERGKPPPCGPAGPRRGPEIPGGPIAVFSAAAASSGPKGPSLCPPGPPPNEIPKETAEGPPKGAQLAVNLTEYNILRSYCRNNIRYHMALRHHI